METEANEAPPPEARRPKKHIGVDIDPDLFDQLQACAVMDDVPLTVIYRWALKDFVAGRKAA